MKVVRLGQFAPDSEMSPLRWAPGGRILANMPMAYDSWVFDDGAWSRLGAPGLDGGVFLGTWLDDTRIAGLGSVTGGCAGVAIIDSQGTKLICDEPNTSTSLPFGRTADGTWWSYATQGQSIHKVIQRWPEADPSQRAIVGFIAQQYQPFGMNALGDYLVRDNSSHDKDPGYAMLDGTRYPDEVTWGVSGAGLSGASVGISDDGTVIGGTVDVGVGFLYRDGGVGGIDGYPVSAPLAIARNGDYAWVTGEPNDLFRFTRAGKTVQLKISAGNWQFRRPVLLSDHGELLFSGAPDTKNLAPLYLVYPADQPNPLGDTALTVTAGPQVGPWDVAPFELHSQDVAVAPTLITWGAQAVLEGHPSRSLALAVSSASRPKTGDEYAVGGSTGLVFGQWTEEGRATLNASSGSIHIDEVNGRTVRITLTHLAFVDATGEVLQLSGTLHTRGAVLR